MSHSKLSGDLTLARDDEITSTKVLVPELVCPTCQDTRRRREGSLGHEGAARPTYGATELTQWQRGLGGSNKEDVAREVMDYLNRECA